VTMSVHGVKILELVSILSITPPNVLKQELLQATDLVIAPLFTTVPLACMDLEEQVEIVIGVQTVFVTLLVELRLPLTVVMCFVLKLEEIVPPVPLFQDVLGANLQQHVWT